MVDDLRFESIAKLSLLGSSEEQVELPRRVSPEKVTV